MKPTRTLPFNRLLPAVLQRPVLTLLTGSVAAQAVSYAARPVLTRFFTPEAFGILSFFLAVTMILSVAACGRFEYALMLPEDDGDAAGLFSLATLLLLGVTALSLPLVIVSAPVARFFHQPELSPYLRWVPAALFLTAWSRLAEQWLLRRRAYKAVSARQITQSVVATLLQVAGGVAGIGVAGLVLGAVGGYLAMTVLLAYLVLPQIGRLGTGPIRRLRALAVRYQRFPAYSIPSSFLSTASTHLPALLLVYFYASEVAGYFGLAYGVLIIPISLFGTAVARAFFSEASEARRTGELKGLTASILDRLFMTGLFPLMALAVAGPEAFAFVFGPEWREAGVYARLLAPWIALMFIASPLTPLFDVFEKQHAELGFSALLFAMRSAVLILAGLTAGPRTAILLYAVAGVVHSVVQTVWVLRLSGVPVGLAWTSMVRYATRATLPLVLMALVRIVAPGPWVLVSAVPAAALYLYLVGKGRRHANP